MGGRRWWMAAEVLVEEVEMIWGYANCSLEGLLMMVGGGEREGKMLQWAMTMEDAWEYRWWWRGLWW